MYGNYMETTLCKNCDAAFQGNYCYNCGQSAHEHSINWHYVWHEIEHGIFHVDKGLFFTIKELYVRPGKTIRDFIAGKRKKYFKPAAMVFLLASFYGFLYHYFNVNLDTGALNAGNTEALKTQQEINSWMTSHFALVTLLTIPLYALGSFMAFRKSGYNFVEHLVLNSFLATQKLVLQLMLFPFVVYYSGTATIGYILSIMYLLDICLTGWTYGTVFIKYRPLSRILRTILTYVLMLLSSLIAGILIVLIIKLF